jgi:hypothetical protein
MAGKFCGDDMSNTSVTLYTKTINGQVFTFEPSDIFFGNSRREGSLMNLEGKITKKSPKIWPAVTFIVRCAMVSDVESFGALVTDNISALVNRTIIGETIEIEDKIVTDAVLWKVKLGSHVQVSGIDIFEDVQLEYCSKDFARKCIFKEAFNSHSIHCAIYN